jgi:hypothetical protein
LLIIKWGTSDPAAWSADNYFWKILFGRFFFVTVFTAICQGTVFAVVFLTGLAITVP